MFDELLESTNRRRQGQGSVLVSLIAHTLLLVVLLVVPLLFYRELPGQILVDNLLWLSQQEIPAPPTPPVPPSPLPDRPATPVSRPAVLSLPDFVQPTEETLQPPDAMLPDDLVSFTSPAGYAEGWLGSVRGVIGELPAVGPAATTIAQPPPLPTAATKRPLKIGGQLASSRLVRRVDPQYPDLARRSRVAGAVLLEILIDELGNVADVTVVRGHRLLYPAALEAVRQWRYSPTLLNGEPVPVVARVTVIFQLY